MFLQQTKYQYKKTKTHKRVRKIDRNNLKESECSATHKSGVK